MPTNVHLVIAIGFPVVMYECESSSIKKAEHQRIYAFELWFWRRLLRVPWTARKSTQSVLKDISSIQALSRVRLLAVCQASLSITNPQSSLKLMSIELVMPSSHLILCHPLLLLASIPHRIRVFSNESTLCMTWPRYWSFSFSIIPSKEIPELIFRMDWLDILAVQGTVKSLLQNHSSKA